MFSCVFRPLINKCHKNGLLYFMFRAFAPLHSIVDSLLSNRLGVGTWLWQIRNLHSSEEEQGLYKTTEAKIITENTFFLTDSRLNGFFFYNKMTAQISFWFKTNRRNAKVVVLTQYPSPWPWMYAVAHVFFSIILTHCVMNYFIVSNHVDADFHNRMLNRSCSFSSASSGKKIHRLLSNITSKLVQINKLLFHCSSTCAQRPFFCKNWLYRYFLFFFFYLFVIAVEKDPSLLNGAHVTRKQI